jgi:hypothetical protein
MPYNLCFGFDAYVQYLRTIPARLVWPSYLGVTMAVGFQSNLSVDRLNQMLGQTAVDLRDSCQSAVNLWDAISALGANQAAQVAALAAMSGWQDSANDPANFWTKANNEFAVAQVYLGLIAQPATFNFDAALAGVRAGL